MRILLKPRFQTNEDAASKMLRASRDNSYSTQPHSSRNRLFHNHYPTSTGHALPPATQRFVQETFRIGSAMRKVLSIGKPKKLPDWFNPEDIDYYVQEYERAGFRGGVN